MTSFDSADLILLEMVHAGVLEGRVITAASSGRARPDTVSAEETTEVSLSFPPLGLVWSWLSATELDTSSEMLSSVDMLKQPGETSARSKTCWTTQKSDFSNKMILDHLRREVSLNRISKTSVEN